MNVHAVISLLLEASVPWRAGWIWGCPLILLTVNIHVLGLGYFSQRAVRIGSKRMKRRPVMVMTVAMGTTTLLAIVLHALEVGIWAIAFLEINALPDYKSAMLYSLGAMTTYGHENLLLANNWQLLGSMEALDGWLLFGLTSAFLFWLIQQIAPRALTVEDRSK
jgi:hypothetical protein